MTHTSLDRTGDAPAAPTLRQDAHSRDIIDLGIAVQQRSSTVSAVEYLRSQGIGATLIERVLGEPDRRRAREV
jgi:hypothetical protein